MLQTSLSMASNKQNLVHNNYRAGRCSWSSKTIGAWSSISMTFKQKKDENRSIPLFPSHSSNGCSWRWSSEFLNGVFHLHPIFTCPMASLDHRAANKSTQKNDRHRRMIRRFNEGNITKSDVIGKINTHIQIIWQLHVAFYHVLCFCHAITCETPLPHLTFVVPFMLTPFGLGSKNLKNCWRHLSPSNRNLELFTSPFPSTLSSLKWRVDILTRWHQLVSKSLSSLIHLSHWATGIHFSFATETEPSHPGWFPPKTAIFPVEMWSEEW